MAFRLKRKESVANGLRRLARKELRAAYEQLSAGPATDQAIHEARRSVKKTRAILQLIKADGGKGLKRARKRLRAVNRALSHWRDMDAMKEILGKLRRKNPHVLSEHTFVRLRRRLDQYKQAVTRRAIDEGVLKEAAGELLKLRRDARRWRPKHRRFSALKAGLKTTHQEGRRAMVRAADRQRSADFHEWRKLVKALWYELRLIESCNGELRRDLRSLHRAETYLGDEHNLTVLCGRMSAELSFINHPVDLLHFRGAANRYQRDLRKQALANVRRIFSMRTGAYIRRARRWWKDWRKNGSPRMRSRSAATRFTAAPRTVGRSVASAIR